MLASLAAALSAVPIQYEHTAIAPGVLLAKVKALVPQRKAEPSTLPDFPLYDQEKAYKATDNLDLEHPVLDRLTSLHTELNIFMWGDSTIARQFFLLRGLTGGLPSETRPLYTIPVASPVSNATLCSAVDVHVHATVYGNATISVTAAVCTTGVVTVAMAPAVLEELQQKHGLSLPDDSLLYIGGSGLHMMHIDDGVGYVCAHDWKAMKPLEEAFEEHLKHGLTELQKRYPDAKLAYFNTHSVCNTWGTSGHSVRALACKRHNMKACFLGVDVPPEEHDWYRETLFSRHGSDVMAGREHAVLRDPSLKWTTVNGHKITKDASCDQTEDGMHYLEPTMMKMIEEALTVLESPGRRLE